jgi:hypothetical protein
MNGSFPHQRLEAMPAIFNNDFYFKINLTTITTLNIFLILPYTLLAGLQFCC